MVTALEVPSYTPAWRTLAVPQPPLPWSKLGMGLLPAAAPVQLEQTASVELPFPSS